MISRFLITILFYAASECSNQRGVPVPQADVLESLISKYVHNQDYSGAVFDFLKGKEPHTQDNLDISVLDAQNVNKLIQQAKKTYRRKHMTRRGGKPKLYTLYYEQGKWNKEGNAIVKTCIDMMKQSIYATRYRMQDTRRFRKIMTNDISYNIGIFYGAIMQISLKLNSLLASMKKLKQYTHFMWFLVIYEKILAGNVDIHNMVDRIYYLNELHQKRLRGEKDLQIAPTIPPLTVTTTKRRKVRRTTVTRRDPRLDHTGMINGPSFTPEAKVTKPTTKTEPQVTTEAWVDDEDDIIVDSEEDNDEDKGGKRTTDTDNATKSPTGVEENDQTAVPADGDDDGGTGKPAEGDAETPGEGNDGSGDDNAGDAGDENAGSTAAGDVENPAEVATEGNAEKLYLKRPPYERQVPNKYKRVQVQKNQG